MAPVRMSRTALSEAPLFIMSTIWLSTSSRLDEVSSASRSSRLRFKRRRDRTHPVIDRAATQLETKVGTSNQIEETSISVPIIGRHALYLIQLRSLPFLSSSGDADMHEIRGGLNRSVQHHLI